MTKGSEQEAIGQVIQRKMALYEPILLAIHTYHFMTVEQVTRLLYSSGSMKHVRSRLKDLADAEYLKKLYLPRATQSGSTPGVFTLARNGMNYLTALGVDGREYFRPFENEEKSYLFLRHTLAINDFLITASLVSKAHEDIQLIEMRHDWMLKQTPIKVKPVRIIDEQVKEEAVSLVPDAWLDFRLGAKHEQVCIILEMGSGDNGG